MADSIKLLCLINDQVLMRINVILCYVVANLHNWSRCRLFLIDRLFVAFFRVLDQGLDGLLRLDGLFERPHPLTINLATKATGLEPATEKMDMLNIKKHNFFVPTVHCF